MPYQVSNSEVEIVLRGTSSKFTGLLAFNYVDTIGKNKRKIHKEFCQYVSEAKILPYLALMKIVHWFSIAPKQNKTQLVLSTRHSTDDIGESTRDKNKSKIVTFFNMTEVGMDLLDKLCQNTNVKHTMSFL